MKTNLFVLAAAAALFAYISHSAFALTVPVAHDTSSGKTGLLTTKAGNATTLSVADNETTLLEFDLSNLDVVPSAIDPTNIKSVILELYVISAKPVGDLTVHRVTMPWSESFSAKSQPLPTIDSTVLATIAAAALPLPGKGYVSVDITGPVVAALQSGSNLSIAIETATPAAKILLGSKDGPAAGYGAALDIEAGLAGAVGPTGPANSLTIGTVTSGTVPAIALTGSSPNQVLNITLAQGPQGLTGATGPAGPTGLTGATGASGATGDPGPANAVSVGTVTTGTFPSVSITGTSPSQTLDFVIPNGVYPEQNTAIGDGALPETGDFRDNNTAVGFDALAGDITGSADTALGANALLHNTYGFDDTAVGVNALGFCDGGDWNTAVGEGALGSGTTGNAFPQVFSYNVAVGGNSLFFCTGTNNIALGYLAGYGNRTGNGCIDIGNQGAASDTGVIRIGSDGTHVATLIAGIFGTTVSGGVPVSIISNGQLGTVTSSRRFKTDIAPMAASSDVLLSLNPVTFKYKPGINPNGIPQYGLIAEDVEKIAPSLVILDAHHRPYTVRYDQVNAMLLNEFLKEHKRVEDMGRTIAKQGRTNAELANQVAAQQQINADQQGHIQALTARLEKMTQQIQAVAQRLDGKDYEPAANHLAGAPGK